MRRVCVHPIGRAQNTPSPFDKCQCLGSVKKNPKRTQLNLIETNSIIGYSLIITVCFVFNVFTLMLEINVEPAVKAMILNTDFQNGEAIPNFKNRHNAVFCCVNIMLIFLCF